MGGLAGVFGALLYANVRGAMEREIDARLRDQAAELARVIMPLGAGKFEVALSQAQVEHFSAEGDGASHYAIWTPDGRAIDASHPSLTIPGPQAEGGRDRGAYRELSRRGPDDVLVLVGQDVRREREQLRNLGALALGAGLAALVLMLVGGWFLTGRMLIPINRISRAAAAVSASNLSERIDASRMESELADLAATINDAFDRLQRAFEQQARFTADASHELRTPLSIVVSQAELALKQPRSADEYRESLDAVRRAAGRMRGVVEGLLTLARADAGEIRLNVDQVDLQEIVSETCRLLEPLAVEKQVTITPRLAPALVRGDRDRLAEAVANVLSNAIRYNVPGGRVDVTLDGGPGDVILRIADTGRGIPEAERPFIFDRFYRVDQARSRSVDGSGLGLAITKWIIDAHGGSIWCRSGENGGAVFELRLERDASSTVT
jgi:heavy metal sensor kinase